MEMRWIWATTPMIPGFEEATVRVMTLEAAVPECEMITFIEVFEREK
jgi:hypothetical protein